MTFPSTAHTAHWPPGVPAQLPVPDESLWQAFSARADATPDAVGLHFLGRDHTWQALRTDALHLAGALQALGVGPGDRVLLFMQNCPQFVVAFHAVLRAGAVVVPVNPMNKADELQHYITDPDARVAICAADLAPELARADAALPEADRLQHMVVSHYADAMGPQADVPPAWQEWLGSRHAPPTLTRGTVTDWSQALACADPLPVHNRRPDDLAVLPYTSGTTGLPKGCMHPHRTLMHNAVASTLWGNASPETVALVVVPLFHITGMVTGMHACLYGGATVVLMPRWDRELAGRLISRWRVTSWTNIPTMVIDLLASPSFDHYDLSSLRYIGGGGAAMPAAVAQRLFDQFGLRYSEGYGLTETAAPSHSNPPDAPRQQCLGIPFMSTDARVIAGRPRPTGFNPASSALEGSPQSGSQLGRLCAAYAHLRGTVPCGTAVDGGSDLLHLLLSPNTARLGVE